MTHEKFVTAQGADCAMTRSETLFSHPENIRAMIDRSSFSWAKHLPLELSQERTPELHEAAVHARGKEVVLVTDIDDVLVDCSGGYLKEFNSLLFQKWGLIPEPITAETFKVKGGSYGAFGNNQNLSECAREVALKLNERWRRSPRFHHQLQLLEPSIPGIHRHLVQVGTPVVLGLTARPPEINHVTKDQLFTTYKYPSVPVLAQPKTVPDKETGIWKLSQLLALLTQAEGQVVMVDDSVSTLRVIEQFKRAAAKGEYGSFWQALAQRLTGLLMMSKITNVPENESDLYIRVDNWEHIAQYVTALRQAQQHEDALANGALGDEAVQFFGTSTLLPHR